ncbi:uncharacterized protein LOC117171094 [Belonocnema kinseyi]|uniref:uncharacterized protein LOC117171094 n=1 Tax=Belonocnema kinseyi TaxID=2817044 RepID=UPI00143CDDBC|nr:uncharacterized protein LOC117171094 [Belonocnema kinseyi]
MGDRKPSELFRYLKSHATALTPEDFILEVWKTRLPSHIRNVMAASSATDIDTILKLAASVHEVSPAKQVSAVSDFTGLVEQIQQLTLQVNALTQDRNRSRSHGSQNQSRGSQNRSATPATARDDFASDWLCFYHRRFKEKATKCRGLCTWPGNDARQQ